MAFELAIIGVVVGIVLGLRYKVLILVPAIMFAIVLAIIVGVARADSFWSIVLTTMTLVTAVQLGYLAGILILAVIAAIWPPHKEGHNSDSRRNSDTEIAYAWHPAWRWDGLASLEPIVNLHPLPPPQA